MEIMNQYGVKTPKFVAASTAREAEAAAYGLIKETGGSADIDFVVKAQVLTGGRGLGYFKENGFHGGVHVCTSPAQVKDVASKMLGNTLITKQTGAEGKKCTRTLIAERFFIRREKYFAILMDRASGKSSSGQIARLVMRADSPFCSVFASFSSLNRATHAVSFLLPSLAILLPSLLPCSSRWSAPSR